jgi:hypothetical protein
MRRSSHSPFNGVNTSLPRFRRSVQQLTAGKANLAPTPTSHRSWCSTNDASALDLAGRDRGYRHRGPEILCPGRGQHRRSPSVIGSKSLLDTAVGDREAVPAQLDPGHLDRHEGPGTETSSPRSPTGIRS